MNDDLDLSEKCVGLYNDAILKIFPVDTMAQLFEKELESPIGNWKMYFPEKTIDFVDKCRERKILHEVCEPLFEQKQFFLDFIKQNFPELTNKGSENAAKLLDIEKKVKDFIQKMEVKSDINGSIIKIDVTLHDIIGNFSTTSGGSLHCQSEKLFLAILFAIKKKVHVFELTRGYKLTFKFAKSSIGKSGLQKSSVICSGDKTITESTDPVDPENNFFKLELSTLDNAVEPEAVEEEQPATMIGDELFEKMMKGEDPSHEEQATYRNIVLQKFKQGNYQVKNIEIWKYERVYERVHEEPVKSVYERVHEELAKSEKIRSEVLDLLLITPNGDVYKKLTLLATIFSNLNIKDNNLNCKDNDCFKIYLITAALLPFFHTQRGGSKSRRKLVRKTRRGRTRTRKSKTKTKSKSKTHRRRRHSRVRKHKKYTSRRR
jgi:hypothetical protein